MTTRRDDRKRDRTVDIGSDPAACHLLTLPDSLEQVDAVAEGHYVAMAEREDLPDGPVKDLFLALKDLHLHAGMPSMRNMARNIGPRVMSYTTVHNVLHKPGTATWGHIELVVRELDGDVHRFKDLWMATRTTDAANSDATASAIADTGDARRSTRAATTVVPQPRIERENAKSENEVSALLRISVAATDLLVALDRAKRQLTDALDGGTQPSISPEMRGHRGRVTSIHFSPDGRTLVSGGIDATVRFWDTTTGQQKNDGGASHESTVYGLCFSPDGKLVASASSDKSIRLWDPSTGSPIETPLLGHDRSVRGVAFSEDSETLISVGSDGTARIWNVANCSPIGDALQWYAKPILAIAADNDHRTFVFGAADGAMGIWDRASQRMIVGVMTGHAERIRAVAFSPDRSIFATGSGDTTARLWSPNDGAPLGAPLDAHGGTVYGISFSPDGRLLATSSYDATIRIWDVGTSREVCEPLCGHVNTVRAVAFSPDGTQLATAGDDATIRLWSCPVAVGIEREISDLRQALIIADGAVPSGQMRSDGSGPAQS